MPVGDQPSDFQGVRAAERNPELTERNVPDDALAKRGRVGFERGNRDRDSGFGRLNNFFDEFIDLCRQKTAGIKRSDEIDWPFIP